MRDLREESLALIEQVNNYIKVQRGLSLPKTTVEFVDTNSVDLQDLLHHLHVICSARKDDKGKALQSFRTNINLHLEGAWEVLHEVELTSVFGQLVEVKRLENKIKKLPDDAEKAKLLHGAQELNKTLIAASLKDPDISERLGAVNDLWSRGLIAPLIWRLNSDFDLRPKGAEVGRHLWAKAAILIRDIKDKPSRLGLCPYCGLLYWDSLSKSGNRKYCYSQACSKQRELEKQKRFWDKEKIRLKKGKRR